MVAVIGSFTGRTNVRYIDGITTLFRDVWERRSGYMALDMESRARHPALWMYLLINILVYFPVFLIGAFGPAIGPFVAVPIVQKVSVLTAGLFHLFASTLTNIIVV